MRKQKQKPSSGCDDESSEQNESTTIIQAKFRDEHSQAQKYRARKAEKGHATNRMDEISEGVFS